MANIFVLDTNVLLTDPESIFKLTPEQLIIPLVVLVELDNIKTRSDQAGKNARIVNRLLDEVRKEGSLEQGIILKTGTLLKVVSTKDQLPEHLYPEFKMDDYIISTALKLNESNIFTPKLNEVTLVSNDLNVRVRANSLGLNVIGYEGRDTKEIKDNVKELYISNVNIDLLYANSHLEYDVEEYDCNQHLVLKGISDNNASALVRVNKNKSRFDLLKKIPSGGIFGIKPKNKEQHFALDLLLDSSIQIVFLNGLPGAGKTLLALAAGLQQVVEDKIYQKVSITRPIVTTGNSLGFLPGTLEEKMAVYMQPCFDLIEFIMGITSKNAKAAGRSYQELFNFGYVETAPLPFLRGKNLPQQYLLIDDAQNMSIHEILTILTRCAEGTKVILCGDPLQIDVSNLNENNNGFSVALEKFKNSPIAGNVVFSKSERSLLAETAWKLLA